MDTYYNRVSSKGRNFRDDCRNQKSSFMFYSFWSSLQSHPFWLKFATNSISGCKVIMIRKFNIYVHVFMFYASFSKCIWNIKFWYFFYERLLPLLSSPSRMLLWIIFHKQFLIFEHGRRNSQDHHSQGTWIILRVKIFIYLGLELLLTQG